MPAVQHPVEIIMARGLVANLVTPAFLVDRLGTLVFFNEPAGEILGLTFEEAGPMPAEDWGGRFTPTTLSGDPLPPDDLPLTRAVRDGRAGHLPMRIRGADGEERDIEVTAVPIIGRSGQGGALAIFWEHPR